MVTELMFFSGTVKSISHLVSICRLRVQSRRSIGLPGSAMERQEVLVLELRGPRNQLPGARISRRSAYVAKRAACVRPVLGEEARGPGHHHHGPRDRVRW